MRLKVFLILILLLFLLSYVVINQNIIIKPYYYLKDLLFLPVHGVNNEMDLSNDFKNNIINSLEEDISNLKELNNINLSISEFDTINATVISRNVLYWFNTLTINKGKSDGIDIDMAVIDSYGLIGRISEVTKNTATVKLITTNDTKNKISAVINDKEKIYGIINGYDSKNNLLNLVINDNIKIEKESIVETTGMGGVFPNGIIIGKVFDVITKDDQITNIVRISPSGNIEGERYVIVLSRKKISAS